MGKGFDIFMQNPYWKRVYENAPGDVLKRYYEITFHTSPFVTGADNEKNTAPDQEFAEVCRKLSREDIEYLYRLACEAQDGKVMSFYRKRLERMKHSEES